MAFSLDAIKKKLSQLNGETKEEFKPKVKQWKPEVGKYKMRFVPWPEHLVKDNEIFIEKNLYSINGKWFLQPENEERDPVGKLRQSIYKSTKAGDPMRDIAKKLWPKQSFYMAAVIEGDQDDLPTLIRLNKDGAIKLYEFFEKKGAGDWTSLENGCVLECKVRNSGKFYNDKPVLQFDWDIDVTEHSSAGSPEKIKRWYDNMPSVDESLSNMKKSEEEIQKIVDDLLNLSPESKTSSSGTSIMAVEEAPKAQRGAAKPQKPSNVSSAISSLDDALAELDK